MSTLCSLWLEPYRPHLEAENLLPALEAVLPPSDESDADAFFRSLLAPLHDLEVSTKIWSTAFADAADLVALRATPEAAFDFAVRRIRDAGRASAPDAATLADASFRLGRHRAGELAAAVAYLAGDRSARTLALLIGMAIREQRLPEAQEILAEALELHPGDADIAYSAAVLAVAEQRSEDARGALSVLTRSHPEFEPGWRLRVDVELLAERWADGARIAREATRRFPHRPDLWERLARAEAQRGRADKALDALRRGAQAASQCVGLAPSVALGLSLREAQLLAREGRWEESLGVYRRLLDSGRTEPAVFVGAASCLQAAGQAESAMELLREGMRLRPEDPDIRSLLGRLLFQARRDAEAFEALQGAAERDPSRTEDLLLMAAIALRGRHFDVAAELAAAVARLDADRRVEALTLLGDAHRFQGSAQAAAEAYAEAERLAPGRTGAPPEHADAKKKD